MSGLLTGPGRADHDGRDRTLTLDPISAPHRTGQTRQRPADARDHGPVIAQHPLRHQPAAGTLRRRGEHPRQPVLQPPHQPAPLGAVGRHKIAPGPEPQHRILGGQHSATPFAGKPSAAAVHGRRETPFPNLCADPPAEHIPIRSSETSTRERVDRHISSINVRTMIALQLPHGKRKNQEFGRAVQNPQIPGLAPLTLLPDPGHPRPLTPHPPLDLQQG